MALKVLLGLNTGADSGDQFLTQVLLPEGTRPGDLLILGIISGFSRPPSIPPPAHCVDSRMTLIGGTTGGTLISGSQIPQRNICAYAGRVGEDATLPIEVLVGAGGDLLHGQFAYAFVVAIRSDDGGEVELDGRVAEGGHPARETIPPPGPPGEQVPGLSDTPDAGSAAICMMGAWASEPGGVGVGRYDPARPGLVWTQLAPVSGYADIVPLIVEQELTSSDHAVPAALGPATEAELGWYAVVMGLRTTLAPVTRQYPRDDGRGLSSARRVYPPPKSQRVIGGHQ